MDPVQFFKCLADETRLRSLLLIEREQELCVCELVEAIDDIQPKISRHLAQLRNGGLLRDRRQGQWVFYRINPELPEWCRKTIYDAALANAAFVAEATGRLQDMGNRPERLSNCC
ncbi:MAG: metalloregulator ArsR/SmtB family transcription factor [Candidatus Pelagadaptatus aseana]|uniref:metalloregulator ArsR/SmtB family transcription factor n=1 Tax=Candidatus Pelagadaptatus aseana TaxID=3120508 RepID=UPI0039B279F1